MNDEELHTKVSPCSCTGEGSIQLHLSRPATAFLVALLDRNNPVFWKGQDAETIELLEGFGKCLSEDIKVAITEQKKVERMDQEKYDRLRAEIEGPDIIMAVGEEQFIGLLQSLMGPLNKMN